MGEAENKENLAALVVESDEAGATLIMKALEANGVNLDCAHSAGEALSILDSKKTNVIILDWDLPQVTGLGFLNKLKSNHNLKHIPVIMVSAKAELERLESSLEAGAADYIIKSTDARELASRVMAAIRAGKIVQKLQKSNESLMGLCRMKDEFLSMVGHDIRAPLNSIVGFAEFLLEGKMGDLNDKQERMVDVIKKSARTQLGLVENLLEVARLNSGRVTLRLRKADLGGIVQECCEGIRHTADKKEIEFILRPANDIVPVVVDDLRISQVANNLLSNALKFTPRGGRVEVDVYRENSGGVFRVKDNGPGIPEEEKTKLFARFEQTKIRSTAGESGFGLGLAIVKSIVDMHNGKVWVESQAGLGSSFSVRLPSPKGTSVS